MALVGYVLPAQARITKVVITKESPTFGGYSWPGVGQYEKLFGTAYGEVDPADPKNSVITDIGLAPTNANGNVEFSFTFYILKPIDLSKGNHKVMYEPPNRGRKTWSSLGRFPVGGNDPGSVTAVTNAAALANAFLMPRGYTMVWSGWDEAAGTSSAGFNTIINLPIAKNPDGSTITGPAFEYIVSPGASYTLTYPAATLDQTKATLTHRVHLDDTPTVVPTANWKYDTTGNIISLTTGNFVPNDIYEFSYTAKDPTVNGLGFAAIRDWNAWLRYETEDDFGTPNPLAGDITRITTETSSQPARTLNDLTHLGFNQAENGKIVFDAMMQWIGAGDGISMNYRWSQPSRTERNRQDHLFSEGVFPFANVTTTDPITGKTDSRFARCKATHTCPRVAEIYSANEYWVKAGSLLHTTPDGTRDLPDSRYARDYFISSHQHGTGNSASKGVCQQFLNPLDSQPIQRALFIALDQWLDGAPPPPTQVPRLFNGTLVPPLPQSGMGFPNIPGVTYTGLKTTRYLLDYGPGFYDTGIPTINPPVITLPYEDNPANGPIYPSFIPKTDSDGNDIAGVRLPDVAVPLATYTGWALRSGPQANDGCESSGQFIPFPKTEADRMNSVDPRLSVAERYPTYGQYYRKVSHAINHLVRRRLMLPEDVNSELTRLVNLGQTLGVPANRPPLAACADVTVKTRACATSARASINHGSSDPDGDKLTLTQAPPGPYGLGTTPVTLTVADPYGGSNSCAATVTVVARREGDRCDGDHDGDDDGDHDHGRH
ncbi:MAG: hypothetical protein LAO06_08805 [Acidobacteriia bacterium]|nr:hypothetical protein [Terriglobia bacterium]